MSAGSSSSAPTLIILEALVLYGRRVAGGWGLDRVRLPLVGTPWARGAPPTPVGVRPVRA